MKKRKKEGLRDQSLFGFGQVAIATVGKRALSPREWCGFETLDFFELFGWCD